MTPIVSARGASFCYGDRSIFSGIDFELRQGETLCLLGSNGCGKTTLLNCLTGALKLKEGTIWIGGEDLRSMNPLSIARRVGVVAQEHSAPFPYPVIEVVRMGRAPYLGFFARPSRRETALAEKALDTVGIGHLAEMPYTQISGGERQLALIARTLCQEPQVILMDEPTSHLDFRNQTLMLQTIEKLAGEGLAVLMTSHFPNHAFLLSSRVALMGHGRFFALGDAHDVVTEENMKATYGMDVKIVSTRIDSEREVRLCVPVLNSAQAVPGDPPQRSR